MNWKETYQQEIAPFDFFHGMESAVCKVNDDFRMKKGETREQEKGGGIYVEIMYK